MCFLIDPDLYIAIFSAVSRSPCAWTQYTSLPSFEFHKSIIYFGTQKSSIFPHKKSIFFSCSSPPSGVSAGAPTSASKKHSRYDCACVAYRYAASRSIIGRMPCSFSR